MPGGNREVVEPTGWLGQSSKCDQLLDCWITCATGSVRRFAFSFSVAAFNRAHVGSSSPMKRRGP